MSICTIGRDEVVKMQDDYEHTLCAKRIESLAIAEQIEAFLSKGGQIQQIAPTIRTMNELEKEEQRKEHFRRGACLKNG